MKSTELQQKVRTFMQLAGQRCPTSPQMPSHYTRRLRANLILEEALETITDLGFAVVQYMDDGLGIIEGRTEPNMEGIVDGCCDLMVVTVGTLVACGVEDRPMLDEVNRSNLSKVTGEVTRNDAGKVQKPANYCPPDIKTKLLEQGWNG